MPCFYPMIAVKELGKDGQFVTKIMGQYKQYYEAVMKGTRRPLTEYFIVPCQKCIGCKLDYAKNWANRCVLEASDYEFNEMLTLTYDDEHLPVSDVFKTSEGLIEVGTLVKKDVQDFLKRLRQVWERKHNFKKTESNPGIRYYMCGEYGDTNGRPHYHLIMFNFPVFDKEILCYNAKGNIQNTSKEILDIWGKGRISLCPVNWETCSYVARYVMKKQTGKEAAKKYAKHHQIPEYVAMSRNPGIARNYFEKHKDEIYETDEIFIPNKNGIQTVKPARYFDNLYDIDEKSHRELTKLKKTRKITAEIKMDAELKKTDLKKEFYLRVKENNQKAKAKQLTREL